MLIAPSDIDLITRTTHFSALPRPTLDHLMASSRVSECGRGKLLFLRGEPATRFFLILSGWVKLFRDTTDGDQTVIAIMKPGETLAEAAIFLGASYPVSAEVVDDARILEIPASTFLAVLREDSSLAIRMLGTLSQRIHHLVRHIEQLQARSTPQRLGEFLLNLTDAREGAVEIRLPYDKSLVAARLGMKPESLSRALAKLRSLGVNTSGNRVSLDDVRRLRAFCLGDDGEM